MNPIPFEPESIDSMRARYPEALRQVYDLEGLRLGTVAWPHEQRRHVFDAEDGLRLVISLDDVGDEDRYIHVCAIMLSGLAPKARPWLRARAAALFGAISGDDLARFYDRGFAAVGAGHHWMAPRLPEGTAPGFESGPVDPAPAP